MTLKRLLPAILLALFSFLNSEGQDRIWTKQSKVSEAIAFEKEINPNPKFLSQNVSLSRSYYPLAEKYVVTNPVIVQREATGHLPVYAEYFYTPQDSILRLISYDWEKDRYGNFFDKQKIWKEESSQFDTYNKEYERIKAALLLQLGNPNVTDSKAKKERSENGTYFTRETLWDTEEMHAELNMTFASMTYRIRLTIYWKK